jgi:carbon monoxide dehydrogenase subunit G
MTTSVCEEVRVAADPDEVWELIGHFNRIPDWHPQIADSTLEANGTVRRVRDAQGRETIERLLSRDDTRRSCRYTILEGLPVSDYTATLAVEPGEDHDARVRWSGEFSAAGTSEAEAASLIGQFLRSGLDNVRRIFERPPS